MKTGQKKVVLEKADIKSTRLKELVKPRKEELEALDSQFLCGEHSSGCRRNSGVIDDEDILF